MTVRIVRVRKCDLPIPLVVDGERGQLAVLILEPAGAKKMGARLGAASRTIVDSVKRFLSRK